MNYAATTGIMVPLHGKYTSRRVMTVMESGVTFICLSVLSHLLEVWVIEEATIV